MKALFIYSKRAGKDKSLKYKDFIIRKLSQKYEVNDFCYNSDE
jgi:hypothetical protein